MPSWFRRFFLSCFVVVASFLNSAIGKDLDKFDRCKIRIDRILNGTEIFRGIDNETIAQYIYTGPVPGMKKEFAQTSRNTFLTLKTEGCRAICEDPIDWYWGTDISMTLGIISNWIIPIIALLATLPYDSFHSRMVRDPWHKGKVLRTFGALFNWIGSPQTALTATLFNIHQMRKCYHETLPSNRSIYPNDVPDSLKKDAYYVLCCLGQFKLRYLGDESGRFMKTLIYGLFHPVYNKVEGRDNQLTPEQKATKWNRELLVEIAFQLRMLRRRGVYPTLISMFLFFIAYAVSLVLAFADIGERTTAHSIAFGVLISWLPLLLLFAILDRNPVSADRSRKLMGRWLWNVEAIKQWVDDPDRPENPNWWSQSREDQYSGKKTSFDKYISEFVGQGRQIGYNGLPYAVLLILHDSAKIDYPIDLLEIVDGPALHLNNRRPGAWWMLALISLALVWLEIGMAFMISYNIPTIGIGCRSMSYLVYGFFSTVPWLIHLLPWCHGPGRKMRTVCRFLCRLFCVLSTLTLCFIIFAAFSGIFKNCLCRGGLSGYLDFEDAEFYRDSRHFDVAKWWRATAIFGALPLIFSVLATLLLLRDLKSLWQTSEQGNPHPSDCEVEMRWLI